MKSHQELMDGYLDASWALAMEQVAIRKGNEAEALEETLAQDPNAAVPRHTVKRCRMLIRKAFAPPALKRVKGVLARAAIVAALCGIMTTAAYAVSPQFRAFLNRVFYSVTEAFTFFSLQDPEIEDVSKNHGQALEINGLRFEWLPEGYEYADGKETERLRRVEFENAQQDYIQVRVMELTGSSGYTYNSENSQGESVKVGTHDGELIDENYRRTLFWVDEQRNKVVIVLATDLSQAGLLNLAESLRY